jgi:glycosyltransferase involved in cell wall biosynthesis
VPYGVWTNRIKKYSYHKCENNTLVFLGHILEKQGIQLVIKAIPKIVERIPNFKFKIIGDGVYKNKLIKLANDLAVSKYCDFKGLISNIKEVENEVAKSCLAIAPYIRELDSWTYFADPGKVKTYLACGIPVLLTEIPWNAREIEGMRCGKIIKENEEDILLGILELMDGIINQKFRNNAIKYSKSFDYEKIFGDLNL